jgi:hypothetical protein
VEVQFHVFDALLTILILGGGYLIRKWVEASNDQLTRHITDCNRRNDATQLSLTQISTKLGTTSEQVARIEGRLNE